MPHIKDYKRIHLIGIGGTSMNGLAQILKQRGYYVQGSDSASSPFVSRLIELNIPVVIGHDAKNIAGAELIIYSAAVKPDNIERAAAKNAGIPQLERSVALGQLTEGYDTVVGIAGCHGKTTITSMLALILEQTDLDATVHVGGYIDHYSGGTRIGKSGLFVTEACEYVESFLTLKPTIGLINNIDDDHLDYFGSIENIVEAFRKYLGLLPENGIFIACTDDVYVRQLVSGYKGRLITYGFSPADYTAENISYDNMGNASFTLTHGGDTIADIRLSVPGRHNVQDALAAAVTAITLGADISAVKQALLAFAPTRRRFEFYGERNGVKIFHDFAHHPSEISAVLQAASLYPHNKLYCVLQCNSYTRAKTLFMNAPTCFSDADLVIVPDIYPGREKDDGTVHATQIVAAINSAGKKAIYLPTFLDIRQFLDENAAENDLVITLGSGDVYKQTNTLL